MSKKKLLRGSFSFEGKRYYVSGHSPTEVEVNKALRLKELEEQTVTIKSNITVSEWSEKWLETYKEPTVNASWCNAIRGMLKNHILPVIGSIPVRNVRPANLQSILNSHTDLSVATMKKLREILKGVFREAEENGLAKTDPAKNLKLPKAKRLPPRRSISTQERSYILQVSEHHHGGLFLKIMLYCGLRPGEVCALQWKNINLDKKTIHVQQALKSDGTIGPPKSDAGDRLVPIPDILIPYLHKGSPFDYVCKTQAGTRYDTRSRERMWRSFKRDLNIAMGCKVYRNQLRPPYPVADDLQMYCLRHTYCTDLQAAGIPINVARELMGHSSIAMTAEIYTHHSEQAFMDAAERINAHACS